MAESAFSETKSSGPGLLNSRKEKVVQQHIFTHECYLFGTFSLHLSNERVTRKEFFKNILKNQGLVKITCGSLTLPSFGQSKRKEVRGVSSNAKKRQIQF